MTTGRGREKSGEIEESRERDVEGETCHVCIEREIKDRNRDDTYMMIDVYRRVTLDSTNITYDDTYITFDGTNWVDTIPTKRV